MMSHVFSSFKRKIKENQYKIRKIKEKKNKIVSLQVSHNTSPLLKYTTGAACRDIVYKLKLKIVLTCLLHS